MSYQTKKQTIGYILKIALKSEIPPFFSVKSESSE